MRPILADGVVVDSGFPYEFTRLIVLDFHAPTMRPYTEFAVA